MAVQKPPVVRVSIPSAHYRVGRLSAITQISDHHVVGDAQHVINKARSVEYSCHYTIAVDGTIYQLVDDRDTSYCDNDGSSNARAITIEHAGGHPNYPYSEAMYKSSIKLHAWLFQTYGNLKVYGHKDIPEIKANPSKATACPGGLNIQHIIYEADKLLKGEQNMPTLIDEEGIRILAAGLLERPEPLVTTPDLRHHIGGDALAKIKEFWYSPEGRAANVWRQSIRGQLEALRLQTEELNKRPTQENFNKFKDVLAQCEANISAKTAELDKLQQEKAESQKTGNAILRFVADWWNARRK